MKKATTRTTIIIVLLIMAVVGYYAYLSNKQKQTQADASMTVVESTLSRDLARDYPPTPREVIKYYNEIQRCLYNEESTEAEIEALGLKARELYDDDLLAINELGSYLIRIQAEVKEFKAKGQRIISMNPAGSVNVDFFEADGYSFAKIKCGYIMVKGSQNYTSDQMYLLRKDQDKRWKIYGWESVENLKEQPE